MVAAQLDNGTFTHPGWLLKHTCIVLPFVMSDRVMHPTMEERRHPAGKIRMTTNQLTALCRSKRCALLQLSGHAFEMLLRPFHETKEDTTPPQQAQGRLPLQTKGQLTFKPETTLAVL